MQLHSNVKPRFNDVPRDWEKLFVISRDIILKNLIYWIFRKTTKMFVVWRCSNNKFLLFSIPGSEQLLINIFSFLSTELYKVTAHKFYPWWSVLHSIFVTCWHTAVYLLYGGTFALLDFVRYNDDFVKSRFVILRFCSIHFTVILDGLTKIVCCTQDFVIQRFHCNKITDWRIKPYCPVL